MKDVFVIAEAGVNHNGSVKLAYQLIDHAVEAGADAVKFQTFSADSIVTKSATQARYQSVNTATEKSQYELLKALELDYESFKSLSEYCESREIQFLSTPFDSESADFLRELEMSTYKIPSGEITNLPYLRHIAKLATKCFLSTGMSSLGDIEAALNVLIHGGMQSSEICVMHANTQYPTLFADANLKAIQTIRQAFPHIGSVGYSDHTLGIEAPIAAVALGATVIEKHFTLNRDMPGPDHKASIVPSELTQMVRAIRNVAEGLGDGVKKPSRSELENLHVVRKSIVAKRRIRAGDVFTEDILQVKRPGSGTSPMRWDDVIGTVALKDYDVDDLI